jgi:general stress protein CsbA
VQLEDFLDDSETLIWSDLSKGPGSRRRAHRARYARDWFAGIAAAALCLSASAALAVYVDMTWFIALALVAVTSGALFWNAHKCRKADVRADIDYGLTATRLIAFDRACGKAQTAYKGAITSILHDTDGSITLYGLEEPVLSLQAVDDPRGAYTLISKTLRPKP